MTTKTQTTHTPGQLRTTEDAHGRGRIYAGDLWIGTTWKATGEGNDAPLVPAVANAARLAACWNACLDINPEAVPDLLDCAKRFDRAIGFFVAALTADHPVAKDLLGLREVARAAIAKAEGGAA